MWLSGDDGRGSPHRLEPWSSQLGHRSSSYGVCRSIVALWAGVSTDVYCSVLALWARKSPREIQRREKVELHFHRELDIVLIQVSIVAFRTLPL